MRQFRLTRDHVKLLQAATVGWNWSSGVWEGAPEIDVKRPYGNRMVAEDVCRIITGVRVKHGELSAHEEVKYLEIHRETEQALAVALSAGSFKPGLYEFDAKRKAWNSVKGRLHSATHV